MTDSMKLHNPFLISIDTYYKTRIYSSRFFIYDAAYIAAWMIDYCNLIGRKVVFETSETYFEAVSHFFLNESEPWGNIVSSMKFTYLLSGYKGIKFWDVFADNVN